MHADFGGACTAKTALIYHARRVASYDAEDRWFIAIASIESFLVMSCRKMSSAQMLAAGPEPENEEIRGTAPIAVSLESLRLRPLARPNDLPSSVHG